MRTTLKPAQYSAVWCALEPAQRATFFAAFGASIVATVSTSKRSTNIYANFTAKCSAVDPT